MELKILLNASLEQLKVEGCRKRQRMYVSSVIDINELGNAFVRFISVEYFKIASFINNLMIWLIITPKTVVMNIL